MVHYCFNMDSFNSIEYSFDLIKSIQSDIESAYTDLFELAKKINQISDEYKTQSPYHINIIDELYINENAHSRILAKLLQFQGPSGAYEILESFIEFIKRKKKSNEFDQIEVNYPIISQEEERIDLWICDYEANCALIFENKIYGATDQRSQLNRYIRKTKDRKFADENIFVFYLTKYGNEPSAQTWGNEETRLKYENRYMALSYRDDILHWLKDFVVPNIRFKDIYLQCATNQYIDYLEGLFSLRHINKSFNMKIQKIISDRLRLETYNEEGAVKKIEETIENLDETRNHLVQLLSKARRNLWSKYLKDLSKIAEKVAEKYKLVCSVDFVEDEKSNWFIAFAKNRWNLYIVFHRYDDDSFFVFVVLPREERVNYEYSEDTYIFSETNEKRNHPYGWEFYDEYNENPYRLIQDITNGAFENYLSEEVSRILEEIKKNKLIM